jgi:hypothetical protein
MLEECCSIRFVVWIQKKLLCMIDVDVLQSMNMFSLVLHHSQVKLKIIRIGTSRSSKVPRPISASQMHDVIKLKTVLLIAHQISFIHHKL